MTSCHKLGGLKWPNLFTHDSRGQESEIKVMQGHGSSEGSWEKSISCSFQLLVAPRSPWLVTPSLRSLPPSPHGLPCVPVSSSAADVCDGTSGSADPPKVISSQDA